MKILNPSFIVVLLFSVLKRADFLLERINYYKILYLSFITLGEFNEFALFQPTKN
jgi:hypothetical protein